MINFKRIFFLFSFLFSFYLNAQSNEFSKFLKIELFLDKTTLGYELPVSSDFVTHVVLGFGGVNIFDGSNEYTTISDASFFIKGGVRYYVSKKRRISKGRKLINNSGTYIGFQTKFNSNNFDSNKGSVLMNEIHFGQQLPLSNRFYFNYNLGIGYGQNLKFGKRLSSGYPAFNVAFGYRIL